MKEQANMEWWQALGVSRIASDGLVRMRYFEKIEAANAGGDVAAAQRVNAAWDEYKRTVRGEIAS